MEMKKIIPLIALVALVSSGCKDDKAKGPEGGAKAPESIHGGSTGAHTSRSSLHSGIAVDTMTSGGYTYVEVEESGVKYWIAAPQFKVKKGEKVSFGSGSWMENFKSKTLNKTFDKILFLSGVGVGDEALAPSSMASAVAGAHGGGAGNNYGIPKSGVSDAPEKGSIQKLEDGYLVSELFSMKKELAGKVVKVRGKVVKVSRNIMGKNWIHIQDGSGDASSNDVTFTSKTNTAKVGSIVIAQGTLAADKDFGAGYKYPVIMENSTFTE